MKFVNEFFPAIIVIVICTLLAIFTVSNSNKNQREIIKAVKEAQKEKNDAIDAAIEKYLKDPEQWQRVKSRLP